MDLYDPRWADLEGGYRFPFDPRPSLRTLQTSPEDPAAWEDLWENLHHQGDVGEASYAALPHLARIAEIGRGLDWNPFALASTIEAARLQDRNPPVPDWLVDEYSAGIISLLATACRALEGASDETHTRSLIELVALAKGLPLLAHAATFPEEDLEDLMPQA